VVRWTKKKPGTVKGKTGMGKGEGGGAGLRGKGRKWGFIQRSKKLRGGRGLEKEKTLAPGRKRAIRKKKKLKRKVPEKFKIYPPTTENSVKGNIILLKRKRATTSLLELAQYKACFAKREATGTKTCKNIFRNENEKGH